MPPNGGRDIGPHDDKLYVNGRLLTSSQSNVEYILDLHDLHHAYTAKTAADLIRRTYVQDAHQKLAEVRRHCQKCRATSH